MAHLLWSLNSHSQYWPSAHVGSTSLSRVKSWLERVVGKAAVVDIMRMRVLEMMVREEGSFMLCLV